MKKLISMLLAVALLFNIAAPVSAAEPTSADYIEVTSSTAMVPPLPMTAITKKT